MDLRDEFLELVKEIPPGKVTNYGALGRNLSRPVSGVVVGGWLLNVPEGVPWWRVVGRDGRLPIWKRGQSLEQLQADRLTAEGVEITDGVVPPHYFLTWD